jgi:hypothetical protein
MGFGSRSAGGLWSWPVVAVIEDRRGARYGESVFGHDHPGGGLDEADCAVVDDDATLVPINRVCTEWRSEAYWTHDSR